MLDYLIWDLVCLSAFVVIVILVSAVRIGIILTLACGIGMSITLRVLRTLTSVLDSLYWYLMCVSACLCIILALVGGTYLDSSFCGLWFWNCNNASSNVGTGTGARLIILKIHIKGIWCV